MITVTANGAAKIYFKGTTVEISSVVARLEFFAPKEGKTIEVILNYYENESAYNSGMPRIVINGVEGFVSNSKSYNLALGTNPETYDAQTIEVAHEKIKEDLESLGYTVVISGI